MESVAIVGATYPHSPAPSRNELRSICTATQSTSISFTVSPTSLAKRTHDEISASLVSDKSEGEAQRCRAQRPRLISTEPAMNDRGLFAWARRSLASFFGWQSANVGGDSASCTHWEEEEQLHNVAQIATSTHSNSYGDVVSTSGTNLPKIDIPSCGGIFRQDELSTKKSGLSALQQLPSPLASEDETHVPKVVMHWHSCTKKSQPPSKPANDGILRLQQKPFYPKSFPSKSSRQLLHESLVRRDRQQERKTNRSNTTLPVHERIVSSQQSEKYQTTQGSISRPAMGVSQSRLAQKATPLPVMRRLDRVSNRVSKPASTKNGWIQAIERAKASGAAQDEHLRAVLRQLQVDSEGRFLNWQEDQARRRRIDAEVMRLKEQGQQDHIYPLNLEQSQEWQKYYNEVKNDYRRHLSKLYISKKFGKETLEIRTEDLATLLGVDIHGGWLNDNIILFYLGLVGERENKERLRVILHNTFFYPKFLKDDFKGVARWTAKKGASGMKIMELDYIVVPICQSHHWTVGVINCKNKRFEYYDSIALRPPQCHYQNLRRYVSGETAGKADLDEWTDYWQPNAPKQQNGRDCGVFVIKTAEVIARGGKPSWNGAEADIGNLRKRMLLEIVHGRLLSIDN